MSDLHLFCPRESCTPHSALLLWDLPGDTVIVRVFLDDIPVASSIQGGCTLTGLRPETVYHARIEVTLGDQSVHCSEPCIFTTAALGKQLDITAFGACGDGTTNNTAAIQNVIDACPVNGVVVVPAGCFVTGALFLHSHMTLHLCEGARLLGSTDLADYPVMTYRFEGREEPCFAGLINTPEGNHTDISITGSGTIDGNGTSLFRQEIPYAGTVSRGRTVCLRNTERVYIQGVTIRHAPAWCTHLIYCDEITLNGVTIHTRRDETGAIYEGIFNGDGFDPDSCTQVRVFNCAIASQDDCIAVKSGRDAEGRSIGRPACDIRITDCHFYSGFGIALGSEMSGGVRNVVIRDCDFRNAYSVLSIKTPRGRGSVVENILCERLNLENFDRSHTDCKWFRGALYIDMYYGTDEVDLTTPQPVTDATPVIRNVTVRNVRLHTLTGNCIYLCGLPERPLENILLENIAAVGLYGMKAYLTTGLTLKNTQIIAMQGETLDIRDTQMKIGR